MAAKILTTYDSQGMDQSHGSSSGQTLGDDEAEYFDPLTAETFTAPSADELAQKVAAGSGFISKQRLLTEIQAGRMQGNIKEPNGQQWDLLVFDLSQYPSEKMAEARRAIIEALKHPNYSAQKNQGGGRFQTMEIKGNRAVSAWGTHTNQAAPAHFHVYVHHHAIDGNRVCPRSCFKDNHIRPNEEAGINAALRAAGLAPLAGGILTTAANTATPAASQAVAQAQAQAAATGAAPMLPPVSPHVSLPAEAVSVFDKKAQEANEEAAQLYAKANEAAARAQTLQQASKAIGEAEAARAKAESERQAREQAERIAAEEQARREEAERMAEQSNANALQQSAKAEELAEALDVERTEKAELESTLQAERDALAEAIGIEAEGEQPENIAARTAVLYATREMEAKEASERANAAEALVEQAKKNEAALIEKLNEEGFKDLGGLIEEHRRKSSELAATTQAKAAAEKRAEIADNRADKAEARAEAADKLAAAELATAQDLRTKLADEKRGRNDDEKTFRESLAEERAAMKKEREDFAKEMKEAMEKARADEASKWEMLVETLKQQLEKAQEQAEKWAKNANEAFGQLEKFLKGTETKAKPTKPTDSPKGTGGGGKPK